MPFAAGIQRLIDCNQRYMQASSAPVFLRVKNFPEPNSIVEDLGFQFTPQGGAGSNTGTSDLPIEPMPSVIYMSMSSLGWAAMAGIQLRAGSKKVIVSNTWVNSRQSLMGYDLPERVWNDRSVVGMVINGYLHEIVSYSNQVAFGSILTWILMCSTTEVSRA